MEFTFVEWLEIRHALEVAEREYVKKMHEFAESYEEYSLYQIYKRQAKETREFIERIENTVLWGGETI